MEKGKIIKSVVVCPKCKSNDLYLMEVWRGHSITWQQDNGEFYMNGNLEAGEPFRVDAKCRKCKHNWKIKRASQISDVTL